MDARDQHLAVQRPEAHVAFVLDGGAGLVGVGRVAAQHALGKQLALVHRQAPLRHEPALRGAPRALGRVHAAGLGHRAVEHPLGQRRVRQYLAGIDVFPDPLGDLRPARLLPEFEGALLHAEAPSHREVHVARALGDGRQVHGRIVKAVAQDRPEEAALRALALTQQLQALGRGLPEHAAVDLVGLLARRHVVALRQVEAQDVATRLLVEAGLGLLPQVAQLQQLGQHRRGREVGVEGIGLRAQVVLQRLHHVGHGVQPHHVGGAEGTRARAPQLLAGEIVHHVGREPELLDLLQRRQHSGDAHAVGDEVGRVLGAHDALAECAGDEGLELVQHLRLGGRRIDQLDQEHVARRVEEVDAAEARLERLGQRLAQLGDRQARGVRGQDRVPGHMGRDLLVQIELPVHALGDGFDHQVAFAELCEIVLVVGLLDQLGVGHVTQWRRLELPEVVDGAHDDAVLRPLLGRQVEQHHRHAHVDEMRRDLRAHHAGAEHGDLLHLKLGHGVSNK
ncbi:hypothetical protein APY03_4873 [Variovorax sp. WDL1]|nr:hypothetical protein APY03_4873 [Variovorax sp. WDL1]